jgi:hypothetical protein
VIFELIRGADCVNLAVFHQDDSVRKMNEFNGMSDEDSSLFTEKTVKDLFEDLLLDDCI